MTRYPKTGIPRLFTVAAGLAVAAGIGLGPAVAVAENVVNVALGSTVAAMDPNAKTSGPPSTIVFYPIFDTLTFTDENGNAVPSLATKWENSSPTTWDFTLREGVTFSNGEPLDAEDVLFTFRRVLDPENKQVVRARINTVSKVEALSSHKVRLHTENPDPILPKRVGSVFILPDKHFREVSAEAFAQKPIGSGPFVMTEFVPASSVTFKAIEGSWRGRPKIDGIHVRSIPEASTRVAALRAGEVHLAESIPPDLAQRINSEKGLAVVAKTIGQVNLIILNTAKGHLAKSEVRRALNYAVDKAAIAEGLMQGFAKPTGQLVAENGVGHDPSIEPYPYDPAKARQMLEAAGATDLRMTIHTTQGLQLNDREVAEAVAGYLSAVGVQADIQVLETAAYVNGYHQGGMDPAFFIGWWYFPAMDGDFVYVWNYSTRPQSRFRSAEFDRLYDASKSEMDPDKRLKILQQVARLFHDEAGAIFLFHPQQTYGLSTKLAGFTPRADRVIWFDSLSLEK